MTVYLDTLVVRHRNDPGLLDWYDNPSYRAEALKIAEEIEEMVRRG